MTLERLCIPPMAHWILENNLVLGQFSCVRKLMMTPGRMWCLWGIVIEGNFFKFRQNGMTLGLCGEGFTQSPLGRTQCPNLTHLVFFQKQMMCQGWDFLVAQFMANAKQLCCKFPMESRRQFMRSLLELGRDEQNGKLQDLTRGIIDLGRRAKWRTV